MKLNKFIKEINEESRGTSLGHEDVYSNIGTAEDNIEGFAAGNDMRVLMDNNTTFKAKIRNATVDFKYTDLRDALKDAKINITSVTQARKIWNTVKNFIM